MFPTHHNSFTGAIIWEDQSRRVWWPTVSNSNSWWSVCWKDDRFRKSKHGYLLRQSFRTSLETNWRTTLNLWTECSSLFVMSSVTWASSFIFLNSHLDQFPDNLGAGSDEQEERLKHDLKIMEERYKGRWDKSMMTDYYWSIKRNCLDEVHKLKSYKRKFLPE